MKAEYLKRIIVIVCLMVFCILSIITRLFSLQIVNGDAYAQSSLKRLVKTIPQKANRGDILDRYGRVIVSSKIVYNLEISKYKKDISELNNTIYELILLAEKYNQPFTDELPVSEKPYKYTSPEENIKKYLADLGFKDELSAPELIDKLAEKYKISKEIISEKYIRKISSVRAEMELRDFSQNNPFIFAKNVDMDIVTVIKENNKSYPGVNIATSYSRFYEEPVAPHILGRVGIIYKDEYDKLKGLGYGLTDVIGKEGIEKSFDLDLKGKDGILQVEQDSNGKIIGSNVLRDAVSGNDIILTIDLNLQKRAEKSLKEMIEAIKATVAKDVGGGAVCVTDIHTGDVLAMASYPDYSIDNFEKDYSKNLNNPQKPFWNRAISGTYEPGSTFKMLTSVAILEENVISTKETIHDDGKYTFFHDYQPTCSVYPGSHGYVNVSDALKVSCNYFFFETGRRLGIEKLNEYSKNYGLGEYTGIELSGESKGILASEYRKKNNGIWNPGDTIQAAIGQSDNLFTPLQLANYVATVVNGGTRFETHLLSKVKNSVTGATNEISPKMAAQNKITPVNYKAIMEGMLAVTEDGTASNVFKDFPIPVGGKTGTAEVPRGTNNGLFVAFAPYDNPKIAISVVVEHGQHGNTIAPVARDIIEEYFNNKNSEIMDGYLKFELK